MQESIDRCDGLKHCQIHINQVLWDMPCFHNGPQPASEVWVDVLTVLMCLVVSRCHSVSWRPRRTVPRSQGKVPNPQFIIYILLYNRKLLIWIFLFGLCNFCYRHVTALRGIFKCHSTCVIVCYNTIFVIPVRTITLSFRWALCITCVKNMIMRYKYIYIYI